MVHKSTLYNVGGMFQTSLINQKFFWVFLSFGMPIRLTRFYFRKNVASYKKKVHFLQNIWIYHLSINIYDTILWKLFYSSFFSQKRHKHPPSNRCIFYWFLSQSDLEKWNLYGKCSTKGIIKVLCICASIWYNDLKTKP